MRDYYSNVRTELLDLIPNESRKGTILEIGAAKGNTLLYAKKNEYAQKIYGIELFNLLTEQEKSEFDGFHIGNIESIAFPFSDVSFDVIICGDVLEHLIDPYALVKNLKKYLTPNGVLIASIPNIREWTTLKNIIFRADFCYQDSGILDKTHLRFFCKKNAIDLFENQNYTIKRVESNFLNRKMSLTRKIRTYIFQKLTLGQYIDFKTVQYYIVAENTLK